VFRSSDITNHGGLLTAWLLYSGYFMTFSVRPDNVCDPDAQSLQKAASLVMFRSLWLRYADINGPRRPSS
jgi:hypothetical protein